MSGIEVQIRLKPCPQNAWSATENVLFRDGSRFVFNHVHGQHTNNSTLFQGIEPFVNAAFTGQNVTVMAYGQTGSGKTHSMLGTDTDRGFIPRAAETLIKLASTHGGVSVTASCIEVYNEMLRDLLSIDREVTLYETATSTTVERSSLPIRAMSDYLVMSARAENNRKYGVTDMNEHSSRSHTILSFEISRQATGSKSILNFVDLAGSECAGKSNTLGQQLREGGFINKSLLALGNVVDAIVDDQRKHVPYRESKLTRVLRPCLGGRSLTYILTCVNPSYDNLSETTAALRFAQRAMRIKNDPTVALNAPPLLSFHLFKQLQEHNDSMKVMKETAFQQGLHDTYTYCVAGISDVIAHDETEAEAAANKMFAVNAALLANEKKRALDQIAAAQHDVAARVDSVEQAKQQIALEQRRAMEAEQTLLLTEKRLSDTERRIGAKRESRAREEHRLRTAIDDAVDSRTTPAMELECHELNCRLAILMDERQVFFAIVDEFVDVLTPLPEEYTNAPFSQLLKLFRDEVKHARDEVEEMQSAYNLAAEGIEELHHEAGSGDFTSEALTVEERVFDLGPQRPATATAPAAASRQVPVSRGTSRRTAVTPTPATPTKAIPRNNPSVGARTPPVSRVRAAAAAILSPGVIIKSTLAQLRDVQSRYRLARSPASATPTRPPTQSRQRGDTPVDVDNIVGIAMRRRIERELSEQRSVALDGVSPPVMSTTSANASRYVRRR